MGIADLGYSDLQSSKRYNSVILKDNCALFALSLYILARDIRWCYLNLALNDPCCHSNHSNVENSALQSMEISKQYNSASLEDSCSQCASAPYFRSSAI